MFIMQVLASQLHFLTNRNAGLTVPPLLWPVNCIKIGVHVELPSGPTVHSLYCGPTEQKTNFGLVESIRATTDQYRYVYSHP